MVLTISTIINFLFTDFIILIDTEELLHSSENKNFRYSFYKRKPTKYRKANEIMYPPKRIFYFSDGNNENDSQSQQKSSNNLRLKNEIMENINNNKEVQNEKNSFKTNNVNSYNNIFSLNNKKYKGNERKVVKFEIKRDIIKGKENYINYIKNRENYISTKTNGKQNFNWFSYIKYMALCGKNNPKISYYVDFRTRLISEENIIQSYIDIYNLLKVNKIKK